MTAATLVLTLAYLPDTAGGGRTWKARSLTATGLESCLEGLYPCPERIRRIRGDLVENPRSGCLDDELSDRICPDSKSPEKWDGFSGDRQGYPRQAPPQSWTVLFYDDADFVNAYDPFTDFVSDAHSDANVNVVVLRDTYGGPAALYHIDQNHNAVLLENRGEVNMGHYTTLRDFVVYGKVNFPADRYLLALYDHGGGWAGACVDNTNKGWLGMADISSALSQSGGVDVICFTAPCLMGAVESTYQLRNRVDVYIGSEDLSGYARWHGIIGEVCDTLNDSMTLTDNDIAEVIIQLVESNTYWPSEWMTMSAIDASEMSGVAQSADEVFQHAIANIEGMHDAIATARSLTWEMGWNGEYPEGEIDFYDFAAQLAAVAPDTVVSSALGDLMDALDRSIIAECHGAAQTRAHGLSIYFPALPDDFNEYYATVPLDFLDDTSWGYLLDAYYSGIVPVFLQHYASYWRGDCIEITWTLRAVGSNAALEFDVTRSPGVEGRFEPLSGYDIVNERDVFTCRDYDVRPERKYVYRVQIYEDGARLASFETEVNPPESILHPIKSHPNPFRTASTISFTVQRGGMVSLRVFDIKGRLVQTLVNGPKSLGDYRVTWNGRRADGSVVPSGVYFVRLETSGPAQTHKIVILR